MSVSLKECKEPPGPCPKGGASRQGTLGFTLGSVQHLMTSKSRNRQTNLVNEGIQDTQSLHLRHSLWDFLTDRAFGLPSMEDLPTSMSGTMYEKAISCQFRVQKKKKKKIDKDTVTSVGECAHACVSCMCVCTCVRQWYYQGQREQGRILKKHQLIIQSICGSQAEVALLPGAKARTTFQSQRSQGFLHTRLADAVSPHSHHSQPQSLPSQVQGPGSCTTHLYPAPPSL